MIFHIGHLLYQGWKWVRFIILCIPLCMNLVFFFAIIFCLGCCKKLSNVSKKFWDSLLYWCVNRWMFVNFKLLNFFVPTSLVIDGKEYLQNQSCLLIANHQSWLDILIMQHSILPKLPPFKFLLKEKLLWLFPFGSWTCWFLDFPFIGKNRAQNIMKIKKLSTIDHPMTVINFLEGSRFSEQKRQDKQSPYQHLLSPHVLGMMLILAALKGKLAMILDVSIVYHHKPSLLAYFLGEIQEIKLIIRSYHCTPQLLGENVNHYAHYLFVKQWVERLWQKKDLLLHHINH